MTDPLFPPSAAIKRLRSYYRDKLDNIDIDQLRSSLDRESDRAIVILTGCILDDLLEYRISKSFRPELTEPQARGFLEGSISSFSNRIATAYVFGIIDKLTAKQLNIIREMRNACAHSVFTLSFQMPELADVAKTLFGPPSGVVQFCEEHQSIRNAFLNEFCVLIINLVHGSRENSIQWVRDNYPVWLAEYAPPPRNRG